jgi:hypothetical protein
MALAKKCDRCGIVYEPYPTVNKVGEYNAVRRERLDPVGSVYYSDTAYDLCKQCMDDFYDFMNNKP